VAWMSLLLFDQLAPMHKLPAAARPYLEAAALLHDIGNAVNYQRHHRHTYYLIQHTDIPGITERERELIARIARYHRRSPPELHHAGMAGLSRAEANMVRKCATLLRLADSLDASHHQPISALSAAEHGRSVQLKLRSRSPIDLELWDAEREAELFRHVFARRVVFQSR
jgi:exopolyphosphatase / guanosine-5'-triphosphate,3'-diphosphate pyrophosphatase